jgi:hypothetical protein
LCRPQKNPQKNPQKAAKSRKKAEKKLKLNILFFFEQKNRMTY